MTPVLLAPALLVGCGDPTDIQFGGTVTYKMFPFEQGRVWEYISTDRKLPYKLIAQIEGKPDIEASINVYTVSYTEVCVSNDPDCKDYERFRIRWSNTRSAGARVHTVIDAEGIQSFDPPLKFSMPQMLLDETVETVTGGRTWSSTFGGEVSCDTNFSGWDSCGLFTVESNLDAPSPLLGSFWAANGHGLATLEFADEGGERWRLSDADCGTCDGVW